MTIKKTWTTTVPLVNFKIKREKVLKPGHTETINIDEMGRLGSKLWIKSDDELSVIPVIKEWDAEPHPQRFYKMEEINNVLTTMTDIDNRVVSLHWELTTFTRERR